VLLVAGLVTPEQLEEARRYCWEAQHRDKYRPVVREEFRVPARMDTKFTRMAQAYATYMETLLALGGRLTW
jgi:hypothetical protein